MSTHARAFMVSVVLSAGLFAAAPEAAFDPSSVTIFNSSVPAVVNPMIQSPGCIEECWARYRECMNNCWFQQRDNVACDHQKCNPDREICDRACPHISDNPGNLDPKRT